LLVLAVDELCSNLIIHSHKCNPDEQIEISLHKENDEYIFEISDYNSSPFNVADYKAPDIHQIVTDKRNGGIGLILVKRIVDKIQFERKGARNICRISKRIYA